MKKFGLFIIILIVSTSIRLLPQEKISVGGYLGGGLIKGNTSEKGSLASSIFFEVDPGLYKDLSFRLSFIFYPDFNSVLPNTTKRYYPFIRGIGFKGITFQNIEPYFFIEEGLGVITLNDRTISDTNEWDYGASFSLSTGFDFTKHENKGFKLSFGSEYGMTFFNTLPSFFSLYLQINYFLY